MRYLVAASPEEQKICSGAMGASLCVERYLDKGNAFVTIELTQDEEETLEEQVKACGTSASAINIVARAIDELRKEQNNAS